MLTPEVKKHQNAKTQNTKGERERAYKTPKETPKQKTLNIKSNQNENIIHNLVNKTQYKSLFDLNKIRYYTCIIFLINKLNYTFSK
jgi:hypothetical protein